MIKEIEFEHDILGNIKFSFLKPDGSPYKNVVFAGENGSGKTTILKVLMEAYKNKRFYGLEKIKYCIDNKDYSISKSNDEREVIYNSDSIKDGHYFISLSDRYPENFFFGFGLVYSKARSGFNTGQISSVTGNILNKSNVDLDEDNYTDIKQLLIDINSMDANDFQEYARKNTDNPFEKFNKTRRIYRFQKAFNSFFDVLEFEKIGNPINGKFPIIFKKYGKEIDIDNLSTGEQQIVFRGGRLLKNIDVLNNSTILIDEPELSLHPRWQKKIFSFYKNLFLENGNQKAQLIIATHSVFVIEEALKDPDTLVILLKNESGTISPKTIFAPTKLDYISSAEVNFEAFGVCGIDYLTALYGKYALQKGKSSIKSIDDCIISESRYDQSIHKKIYNFGTKTFNSLPTYIRNCIDHPDLIHQYTDEELKIAILLLRDIII